MVSYITFNLYTTFFYLLMNFSTFQNDIFDFVTTNNNKSLTINAVAGSGKTTTAIEAIKRIPRQEEVLAMAFNKSIATEWQTKMAVLRNVQCRTLHSHGMKTFIRAKIKTKLDNNKWQKYITENELSSVVSREDNEYYLFCSNTKRLLDLCRLNLLTYGQVDEIEEVAERHNIECIADEVTVVNDLLNLCYSLDKEGNTTIIDFTDMIVLPTMVKSLNKYVEKFPHVFIDEAQDLSKAQQALMLMSIAKNGRFIAVGDPRQSINGFCGAMNDSFTQLEELAQNSLPLSVNYRCGRNMINLAQEIVPQIEAHDDAIDGVVDEVTDLKNISKGDMIICRKSAPLIGLCLRLLSVGKIAYVKGQDICDSLKTLIKKSKADDIESLFEWLDKEIENQRKKLIAKGIKADAVESCPSIIHLQDKLKCLQILTERCCTLQEVNNLLDKIFTEVNSGKAITLSTVHKSKGLEADNVFIALPNCLPMTWKGQQSWEYEQECNLKYVAVTRAKKQLHFIKIDEDQLKDIVVD